MLFYYRCHVKICIYINAVGFFNLIVGPRNSITRLSIIHILYLSVNSINGNYNIVTTKIERKKYRLVLTYKALT